MHRKSLPHCLGWSLLLALGLHVFTAPIQAQPPAGGDADKDVLKIRLGDEPKIMLTKPGLKLDVKIDNPRVLDATVVSPGVLRLTGKSAGRTTLILTYGDGTTELKEVNVVDSDEELFQVQRKLLEKRREILLQLIRQTVPTANVDVVIALQRSRVAVGQPGVGVPSTSGPNDNFVLTGTIILTGMVFEVEKIHTILDLTNGVFGGNALPAAGSANPGGGQGSAAAPGGGTPAVSTAGGGGAGTVVGNQATGGQLGNRITVINNLRLAGIHQIELGVVMAVVNRTEARAMGFNWFNNQQTWFLTSFVNPALGVATGLATAASAAQATGAGAGQAISSPPQFGFGVLNPQNGFSGFLQALRTENLVKILAEPRLMTLSGRPANFIDGGQIPIITSSTGGSSVSFLQFGTVVNFVPIVLGNGKIHLEVAASISQPNSTVGVSIATAGSLASAPGLTTRGAQVAVQLEDGQTLAIGGLIQNTVNAQTSKIPVLGDLPFFGAAFRAVTYTESEEELIILVTPRLVDPMACNQLKPYPGRETRSADDYELFLEGIMEAPRGHRNVFRDGHYVASHKEPGANQIPFSCNDEPRPPGYLRNGSCASGNCFSGQPAPTSPSSFQPPSSANQSTFSGQPTFNGQPTYVTQPSYMTRPTFGQSRPDSQLGAPTEVLDKGFPYNPGSMPSNDRNSFPGPQSSAPPVLDSNLSPYSSQQGAVSFGMPREVPNNYPPRLD